MWPLSPIYYHRVETKFQKSLKLHIQAVLMFWEIKQALVDTEFTQLHADVLHFVYTFFVLDLWTDFFNMVPKKLKF